MKHYNSFRSIYILCIILLFFSTCNDAKGFGGGRGGGFGGKGGGVFGGKGGGTMGGSKGAGTFGGSSNYARGNSYGGYNNMGHSRSGSSFGKNAMAFGAGAVGGIAAYSLMRSMSSSYHPDTYRYNPGYGQGEICINNDDLNGTKFGSFRCPLNEFSRDATFCCGEPNQQFCCARERRSNFGASGISFGGIFMFILLCIIVGLIIMKCRRRQRKDIMMVPVEPPPNEPQGPVFYQPPPPPMGYPPPPSGNPYAQPPQNYDGSYNPYLPQQQMSYPPQEQVPYPPQQQMPYQPQQQMPYPPQQQMHYPPQQPPYNPYPAKEGAPPKYDDAMYKN